MTPAPGDVTPRNAPDTAPAGAHQDLRTRLGPTEMVFAVVGGLLLLGMMALTVADVIGRYLFSAPLRGATELTEVLLCAVIFIGLGAVALREDHVTVDLLTDRMPGPVHPWRLVATGLFSGLVLAIVAWRLWIYAGQIGGYGGTTTTLAIPIAPLGYFCAICAAVGALISALLPVRRLLRRI